LNSIDSNLAPLETNDLDIVLPAVAEKGTRAPAPFCLSQSILACFMTVIDGMRMIGIPMKTKPNVSKLGFLGVAIACCTPTLLRGQNDQSFSKRVSEFFSGLSDPKQLLKPNDRRIWSGKASDYFDDRMLLAVCEAISKDNLVKLRGLLDANLEINKAGQSGMTVLYFAYLEGKLPAFELLLKQDANPDVEITSELPLKVGEMGLWERTRGFSVLMHSLMSESVRPGFFDAAIVFTKKPNQRDVDGNTFLHQTVHFCALPADLPRLKAVLATGIDLNIKNKKGETAAHLAVQYSPVLLLELLKAGADPRIALPSGTSFIQLIHDKSTDPENPLNEYYDRVVAWLDEHSFRP